MDEFNLEEFFREVGLNNQVEKDVLELIDKLSDDIESSLKAKLKAIIIYLSHNDVLPEDCNERLTIEERSVIGSWAKECPKQIISFTNSIMVNNSKFKLLVDAMIELIRLVMHSKHTDVYDKKRLYIRGKLGLIFCSDIDKLGFDFNQYFSILKNTLEMEYCTFDCLTLLKELLENPIDNNPDNNSERNEKIISYIISHCHDIVVPTIMNDNNKKETNGSVFISRIIRTEALWSLDDEYIDKVLRMSLLNGHSYFMYRLLRNEKLSINRIKLLIDYYDVVLCNFYIDNKFVIPEMLKRSRLPLLFIESCPNFDDLSDDEIKKMLNTITTTKYPFSMANLYYYLLETNHEKFDCAKGILKHSPDDARFTMVTSERSYRYLPEFDNIILPQVGDTGLPQLYKDNLLWVRRIYRYDLKDMLSRIACLPSLMQQSLDTYKEILSIINSLCESYIIYLNNFDDWREYSEYHSEDDTSVKSHFSDVIDAIYDMLNLRDSEGNYVYDKNFSRCGYVLSLVRHFIDNYKISDSIWEHMFCALQFASSAQSIFYDDQQFKQYIDSTCLSSVGEVLKKTRVSS